MATARMLAVVLLRAARRRRRPAGAEPQELLDRQRGRGHVALGLAIRKLGVAGTFMQAPAHPDDETNALFALFRLRQGMRVIDVQNNRGEGGQNEIGPSCSATSACCARPSCSSAHRIDGAEQYFTRAIDYGYSFDPQESSTSGAATRSWATTFADSHAAARSPIWPRRNLATGRRPVPRPRLEVSASAWRSRPLIAKPGLGDRVSRRDPTTWRDRTGGPSRSGPVRRHPAPDGAVVAVLWCYLRLSIHAQSGATTRIHSALPPRVSPPGALLSHGEISRVPSPARATWSTG